MNYYCLGFVKDSVTLDVPLIYKLKPEIHRGKYNGVGGKLEEGESALESMVREFQEEIGEYVPAEKWTYRGRLEAPDGVVYCFTAVHDLKNPKDVENGNDLMWFSLETFNSFGNVPNGDDILVPNLEWLIRLCFDEEYLNFVISYKSIL